MLLHIHWEWACSCAVARPCNSNLSVSDMYTTSAGKCFREVMRFVHYPWRTDVHLGDIRSYESKSSGWSGFCRASTWVWQPSNRLKGDGDDLSHTHRQHRRENDIMSHSWTAKLSHGFWCLLTTSHVQRQHVKRLCFLSQWKVSSYSCWYLSRVRLIWLFSCWHIRHSRPNSARFWPENKCSVNWSCRGDGFSKLRIPNWIRSWS